MGTNCSTAYQVVRIQVNGAVFLNSIFTQLPLSAGVWLPDTAGQAAAFSGRSAFSTGESLAPAELFAAVCQLR